MTDVCCILFLVISITLRSLEMEFARMKLTDFTYEILQEIVDIYDKARGGSGKPAKPVPGIAGKGSGGTEKAEPRQLAFLRQ
jgi:hypothetical protein